MSKQIVKFKLVNDVRIKLQANDPKIIPPPTQKDNKTPIGSFIDLKIRWNLNRNLILIKAFF